MDVGYQNPSGNFSLRAAALIIHDGTNYYLQKVMIMIVIIQLAVEYNKMRPQVML